jgi:TonB family protein
LIRFLSVAVLLLFASITSAQESAINPATPKPAEPTAPVPPDSTQLEVIKSVHAAYPLDAVKNEMQGQVRLKLLIDQQGNVESAEVIEGDEVFRKPAIDAVKKWKYKPYIKNGKPVRVSTTLNMDFVFSGKTEDKKDPDLDAARDGKPADPNLPKRVRVSQGVSEGMLIHKVQPSYPPEARQGHVQGTVVLKAVIGKDGRIQDLTVLNGPPELRQSALGAVRQWRYKPYYLMGSPVEVDTQITVRYQLR